MTKRHNAREFFSYSCGYSRRHVLHFLVVSLLPAALLGQQPIDQWNFDETGGSVAHNSVPGRAEVC